MWAEFVEKKNDTFDHLKGTPCTLAVCACFVNYNNKVCLTPSSAECEVCGAVYKSQSGFKAHQWDKHGLGKSGKIHTCDICGKTFRGKTHFESHVGKHKKVSMFTLFRNSDYSVNS